MDALDIAGEPLPILWTADFIPVDNHVAPYVIGEFNCQCVSINKFAAAAGHDLKAVSSADKTEGYKLTKLMGKKVTKQWRAAPAGAGRGDPQQQPPRARAPPLPACAPWLRSIMTNLGGRCSSNWMRSSKAAGSPRWARR